MGNESNKVEKKVDGNKIYEELGTNYRHFLRWRYAVVLAVGIIDFAAYKVIVESHPTKFLIIICFIVFIAALFSLLSYELRSAEMYRRIIKAAKEIEGRKEGYYTILDRDNDQNDNDEKKGWSKIRSIFRNDILKPTHTGTIVRFILLSTIAILLLGCICLINPSCVNTPKTNKSEKRFAGIDSTLDSITNVYDTRLDSIDSKFDSITIRLQNLRTETKPSATSARTRTTSANRRRSPRTTSRR